MPAQQDDNVTHGRPHKLWLLSLNEVLAALGEGVASISSQCRTTLVLLVHVIANAHRSPSSNVAVRRSGPKQAVVNQLD